MSNDGDAVRAYGVDTTDELSVICEATIISGVVNLSTVILDLR